MPPAAGGHDAPQTPSKRKERVPHPAVAGHGTLSFRPKAVRRAPLRIRETPRFFSREECKDVGKGFLTVNPEEGKSVETGKGYLRIGSSGGEAGKTAATWKKLCAHGAAVGVVREISGDMKKGCRETCDKVRAARRPDQEPSRL